jgi:hypothetical protein
MAGHTQSTSTELLGRAASSSCRLPVTVLDTRVQPSALGAIMKRRG